MMIIEDRHQTAVELADKGILEFGTKPHEWFTRMLEYNRYYECDKLDESITLTPGAKILDFGCGVADFGIYFASLGADVWLNDRQEEFKPAVDYRFEKLGLSHKGWVDEDELPQDFYDLVIANEVLEHVPDTAITFLKLAKSVKIGGWLYSSNVPFREGQEYYERRGHNSQAPNSFPLIKQFLAESFEPAKKIDSSMWIMKRLV